VSVPGSWKETLEVAAGRFAVAMTLPCDQPPLLSDQQAVAAVRGLRAAGTDVRLLVVGNAGWGPDDLHDKPGPGRPRPGVRRVAPRRGRRRASPPLRHGRPAVGGLRRGGLRPAAPGGGARGAAGPGPRHPDVPRGHGLRDRRMVRRDRAGCARGRPPISTDGTATADAVGHESFMATAAEDVTAALDGFEDDGLSVSTAGRPCVDRVAGQLVCGFGEPPLATPTMILANSRVVRLCFPPEEVQRPCRITDEGIDFDGGS
jgi:hypothetical protein